VLRHEAQVQHMLHPVRRPVPASALAEARQRLPELQEVVFRSPDGLTLRGWYQPSRNRAAVLLVHGAGENRLWWLDEAEALARRGFGVLLYDSRAHGESEGGLQSWGEHEQLDVIGALDFLSARPDVDPARLGAEGFRSAPPPWPWRPRATPACAPWCSRRSGPRCRRS
jgi:dipeptidyl aminopeptidase/acylaminoacyl peptidase